MLQKKNLIVGVINYCVANKKFCINKILNNIRNNCVSINFASIAIQIRNDMQIEKVSVYLKCNNAAGNSDSIFIFA